MLNKIRAFLTADNIEAALSRGVLQAFFIQGFGAVLLLSMELVAARLLGAQQFGVFSIAMAWITLLSLLATLGLNHALLRFVPTYVAHLDWGHLKGLLKRANYWAGLGSSLLVLVGIVTVHAFDTSWQVFSIAITLALLAIPLNVLSSLRQSTLRGLDRLSHALTPEFILRPLFFMGGVLAATLHYGTIKASHALAINLAVAACVFVIGAIWQRRYLPVQLQAATPAYQDKEWVGVALPLLLIVGFNLIGSRIGVVLLGLFSDAESAGIYAAASKVADIVVFGLASANAVVAPMIARLYATQQHDALQQVITAAAKKIAFFTVPAALALLLFGERVLLIFGAEFSAGYQVLVILVFGQIINALAGPVGYLMMMTGHQNKAAKIVALSAVLNLLLSIVLIPITGIVGAAIATTTSIVVWNVLMLRFVELELSIKSSLFSFWIKS